MTALVIAEHDNASIKGATLNTVTAAAACGGDVHVLIAGHNAGAAAQAAAQITGVSKVIHADSDALAHGLAENVAAQVLAIAGNYSHILFPATAGGKNVAPRVAAKLDVAQISDVTKVESADTFERPIYAGNAIATVQSADATKVITVRTTGFDAAAATGGAAAVETAAAQADSGKSTFKGSEIAKNDRPELTAAKIIVSGGREQDVAVVASDGQHLGRDVLGQAMGQGFAVGMDDLGDASDLGGGLGGGSGVVTGHQHMHIATAGSGGGHGVEGGALDGRVVVFGNDECGHDQITFATFLSLSTSVATSGTLMPALRLAGSMTLRVLMRGATSTPRSSGLKVSSCFFLAFMMLGSVT